MSAPYLLVLAHQRSGSNHLLDLLRGFVGVTTLGEFFNITATAPGKMYQAEALSQYGGSVHKFIAASVKNPLEPLRFREDIQGTSLFVVKLFGHQLKSKRAQRILIDNAVGVIHLRRNVFGTWVSRELTRQSGDWFNTSSEGKKVTFTTESFVRYGSRITAFAAEFSRLLRRSRRPYIDMTFTEISAMNQPQQIGDLVKSAFPDLPELILRDDWDPLVSRQDTRLPIDRVANAEFARTALKEMGLEYLLNNEDGDDVDVLHSILSPKPRQPWWRSLVIRARHR